MTFDLDPTYPYLPELSQTLDRVSKANLDEAFIELADPDLIELLDSSAIAPSLETLDVALGELPEDAQARIKDLVNEILQTWEASDRTQP
ncbi:MAG TPA: hypothetical protein V6D19_06590 [Stenomitos sp.]